jgi:hypothetical protein
MPTEKEPREKPAQHPRDDAKQPVSVNLVDYFDQMDRDAFRRSLEYRDSSRARTSSD